MDISIIIVNYKCKACVLNCVKSIKEADWTSPFPTGGEAKLKYEIIVVDNNSHDSLKELLAWQFPDIQFIQNDKNLGMGAGNNVGIKKAQGKYIVIMNPDTIAFPDTFTKLFGFMANNPKAGIAGPKQYNPDKTIQASCYRWYKILTPLYRRTPLGNMKLAQKDLDRFLMVDFDHNSIRKVDWLLGSFLFCRSNALAKVGNFDERFFLYFEDTDLCLRFWNKGYEVVYYPEAEIIHNHARESAREPWYKFLTNPAARYHIFSWLKYLYKWGLKAPEIN